MLVSLSPLPRLPSPPLSLSLFLSQILKPLHSKLAKKGADEAIKKSIQETEAQQRAELLAFDKKSAEEVCGVCECVKCYFTFNCIKVSSSSLPFPSPSLS